MTMIRIEGHDVNRIEYKGQPIITFKMVDELHGRPEGTARVTFNRNKDRFILGEHYHDVSYIEWSQMTAVCLTYGGQDTGQRNSIKFFTEAGYLLLVKPFTDDRAWKVQDCLIRDYFKMREAISSGTVADPFTLSHQKALTVAEVFVKAGEYLGTSREMARAVAVKTTRELTGVDFSPLLIGNTVQEKPVTPTELARLHGVTPRKINTLLETAGFQKREGKQWAATEKGRLHSTLDPYQSAHSNHSGYRLLWSSTVLNLLKDGDA